MLLLLLLLFIFLLLLLFILLFFFLFLVLVLVPTLVLIFIFFLTLVLIFFLALGLSPPSMRCAEPGRCKRCSRCCRRPSTTLLLLLLELELQLFDVLHRVVRVRDLRLEPRQGKLVRVETSQGIGGGGSSLISGHSNKLCNVAVAAV